MPSGVPSAPAAAKDLGVLGCQRGCSRGCIIARVYAGKHGSRNTRWGCSNEPHQGPILRKPPSISSYKPPGTGEKKKRQERAGRERRGPDCSRPGDRRAAWEVAPHQLLLE